MQGVLLCSVPGGRFEAVSAGTHEEVSGAVVTLTASSQVPGSSLLSPSLAESPWGGCREVVGWGKEQLQCQEGTDCILLW